MSPNPAFVGQDVVVTADIQNTGTIAGDEVPQLYIHENSPKLPDRSKSCAVLRA